MQAVLFSDMKAATTASFDGEEQKACSDRPEKGRKARTDAKKGRMPPDRVDKKRGKRVFRLTSRVRGGII